MNTSPASITVGLSLACKLISIRSISVFLSADLGLMIIFLGIFQQRARSKNLKEYRIEKHLFEIVSQKMFLYIKFVEETLLQHSTLHQLGGVWILPVIFVNHKIVYQFCQSYNCCLFSKTFVINLLIISCEILDINALCFFLCYSS